MLNLPSLLHLFVDLFIPPYVTFATMAVPKFLASPKQGHNTEEAQVSNREKDVEKRFSHTGAIFDTNPLFDL